VPFIPRRAERAKCVVHYSRYDECKSPVDSSNEGLAEMNAL